MFGEIIGTHSVNRQFETVTFAYRKIDACLLKLVSRLRILIYIFRTTYPRVTFFLLPHPILPPLAYS